MTKLNETKSNYCDIGTYRKIIEFSVTNEFCNPTPMKLLVFNITVVPIILFKVYLRFHHN